MKSNLFQTICLAALLIGGAPGMAPAADNLANFSVADIVRQSQAKYASLTSYSDDGTTAATLGHTLVSGFSFTIKLARTNLYQVIWRQGDEMFAPKGVVWSSGGGDFLWMGKGVDLKKLENRETALGSATGISGGAAATVPGTFFKLSLGSQLWTAIASGNRLADEKVGDTDCFVLTHTTTGRTTTLWIGKQDLLIRQVRNFTSGEVVKQVLEAQAKNNPQIRAALDASGSELGQDVTSVEVHQHIVLNPPLTSADFTFEIPPAHGP